MAPSKNEWENRVVFFCFIAIELVFLEHWFLNDFVLVVTFEDFSRHLF